MGFFLNNIFSVLMFIVALVAIAAAVAAIIIRPKPGYERQYGDRTEQKAEKKKLEIPGWTLVFVGVSLMALFVGWYTGTHRLVPVNTTAVVVNRWNSQPEDETRNPGFTSVPLWAKVMEYPGQTNYEMCDDYTPSVKGGYEIATRICFYFDASRVDWHKQFVTYNKAGYSDLRVVWVNQLKQGISVAMAGYVPSELTEKRDEVVASITSSTADFFAKEGVQINKVTLFNWDFTSDQARSQYEQTMAVQNDILVQETQLQVSQKRRDVELYDIETTNLVLEQRAQGVTEYLTSLGITDQSVISQVLTILYLEGLDVPPGTLILNTGDSAPDVAVPAGQAQPQATQTPTPTPTEVPEGS